MKKIVLLIVFLQAIFFVSAQEKDRQPGIGVDSAFILKVQKDSIRERYRASATLRALKQGSLIVRLKTNQKSVDAYRRAGKEQIARRIEQDRKNQNLKLYWAFRTNFKFCKVYFIYAHETANFLNGEKGLFLNQQLEKDPSISFPDSAFVFCEYGIAQPYADFNDYANKSNTLSNSTATLIQNEKADTIILGKSTASTTTSGLVLSDRYLQQLNRPFPYVVPVLGESFNAPVKALSRELERAYGRLVIRRDFNQKVKETRKKQKDLWNQYNQAK